MEQSVVSVDTVALRFWPDDERVTFGVASRGWEPFRGRLALPGVLLRRGEQLAAASRRALTSKLAVPADAVGAVGQLITFDEPNRDPRGPTLSIAMWAIVAEFTPPTPGVVDWSGLDDPVELAFDHNRIVARTRSLLCENLWKNTEFTRALTGPRFTASRAITLTASLAGTPPDPGNLNRTLRSVPGLARTEERVRVKATGRPAAVWEWEQQ